MIKRILLTLLGLLLLVGAIAGVKFLQIKTMMDPALKAASAPPPETVTTAEITAESWESSVTAVGSLAAVKGVMVASELQGKIETIAFQPGTKVQAGDLLVKLDTTSEEVQLQGAEADLGLAKVNLDRAAKLVAQKTIAQADYDTAEAKYKISVAQVDAIRVVILKKHIRAPFAGHLGVRLVNEGHILKDGEAIVSLQTLDPIYVNILLPQEQLARIKPGMKVRVTSEVLGGQPVEGKISTINPEVEGTTRNVKIQTTLANPKEILLPGMFVDAAILLPIPQAVTVIPATAVLPAPYSDSVFVVEEKKGENGSPDGLALRQQFIRLGEKRGDFVAVVSGLNAGQKIVSTGVFKLRNGQSVVVNNTLNPNFSKTPKPEDK